MQELFTVIILIISVVLHEISHGYAALFFGDSTAKLAGRLTLNPLKHLDPVGSVIIPLLFVALPGNFIFGWARPVPYNPTNLRNLKWGTITVASAGVLANFLIAIIFGLLIRFGPEIWAVSESFLFISKKIVLINILLVVFNLIPIPPLDGSKILFSLMPNRFQDIAITLERYAIFILLFLVFLLGKYIWPVIVWFFWLLTGEFAL